MIASWVSMFVVAKIAVEKARVRNLVQECNGFTKNIGFNRKTTTKKCYTIPWDLTLR